jgi:molecular chaperone DnaK
LTERSGASTKFHRVIGIDLGTTSCAVAVWDGSTMVLVPSSTGAALTPAVVGQNSAGQVVVGQPPIGDVDSALTAVKRLLGTGDRIRFRGSTYLPREICAFLLIELKRQAEAFIGAPVHDAVLTVPSAAGEAQRRALREAAGLAQLNVRLLLDDPVAAAMAFGSGLATSGRVVGAGRIHTYAIYDLGGGTFDTSIVRIGPGTIDVLGTVGDSRLGGDDFDERIVDYVLRQVRERHHVDLGQDERIRRRIRWEAELRKRELSTADLTMLHLPLLTATVSAAVPLTRRTFEAMIEPEVQRSIDHLTAAIAIAGMTYGVGAADVEQVLLTGGSTRIPSIRRRLAEYFGLSLDDVRTDLDPQEVIARGAGLIARDYEPAPLFDGPPAGLIAANLRLRAEMADPAPETATPEPPATGTPRSLPRLPAETPADFRPAAERARTLLTRSPAGEHVPLRAAYLALVDAVNAAAPDDRLTELGETLIVELDRAI